MTRLINDMRNKLVINIMADIPRIDYKEIMAKRFDQMQIDSLPFEIKQMSLIQLRNLFGEYPTYFSKGGTYLKRLVKSADPDKDEILTRLAASNEAQDKRLNDIKMSLMASLGAVTTIKSLLKTYPEFEKYLDIRKDIVNLPACNVITDLMKAGWQGAKNNG